MKNLFIFLLTFLCHFANVFSQNQTKKIKLNFDRYEISCSKKQQLVSFLNDVELKKISKIKISWHDETDKEDMYCKPLYLARCARLTEFLQSKGISKTCISTDDTAQTTAKAYSINWFQWQPNNELYLQIEYEQNQPYNSLKNIVQHFKFQTSKMIQLVAKAGTEIVFPAFAFIHKNGSKVNDEVNIDVIEIYTKADMVLYQVTTSAGDKLLESGGMVKINVTCKGENVDLDEGVHYQIKLKNQHPKFGMSLFYGNGTKKIDWENTKQEPAFVLANRGEVDTDRVYRPEHDDSLIYNRGGDGYVYAQNYYQNNYRPEVIDGIRNNTQFELHGEANRNKTNNRKNYVYAYELPKIENEATASIVDYAFDATQLGWINCDKYYNAPNKTNLVVKVTDDNAAVVIVFKKINSVTTAAKNGNYYTFTNVPVGEEVKVIAISEKDKNVVFGSEDLKIGMKNNFEVNLNETGKEELKKMLVALN